MSRGLSRTAPWLVSVLVTLVAAPPAPAQGGGARFAVLPFENTGSYGQDREVFEGLELAFPALLASALDRHPLGKPACLSLAALCFGAVALLQWPLLYVLAGLGTLACVLTWRKIRP